MPRSPFLALVLALACAGLLVPPATASTRSWDPYWNDLGARVATETAPAFPHRAFGVSLAELRERLALAHGPDGASIELTLPDPEGRLHRYRVVESPVLGPEMRAAMPDVRTYAARGLDDASAFARVDVTRLGVRAVVLTAEGTYAIDPLVRGRTDRIMAFWAKDEPAANEGFECEVRPAPGIDVAALRRSLEAPREETAAATGDTAYNFRYVIVAPGEYTQWLGGDTLVAMAELVTAVNRVNSAYERDLSIHLECVWLKAWSDPATDPFPQVPTGNLLERTQTVVDSLWGHDNYDCGQLLSQQGVAGHGGLGYYPSVCSVEGIKIGSYVTGAIPTDLTTYRILMHELGHNFFSLHSWDAPCNRSPETAAEPYSGSTIMGRAGRCAPYNVQAQCDWYFHPVSLEEIDVYLQTATSCAQRRLTGNSPPTANAGPDYTIPYGTPFLVTGQGSDPNAADTLSYEWEQMDIAPAPFDLTLGPLFRSILPSPSPERSFPSLPTVLSNTLVPWDRTAAGARTIKLRLCVRGTPPGIGGHATDDVVITVAGAPFVVNAPNGGESVPAGTPYLATWTVGGGTATHVDLELSKDGGHTWTPLALATPNDGAEMVAFPPPAAATCRVRAKAVGNVYYDVSNTDFAITGPVVEVDPVAGGEAGFSLAPVAPNPSSGDALVRFTLDAASDVDLRVVSANGRLVRRLASGRRDAGNHTVAWDGRDDGGRRVAAGAYVVQLEAGDRRAAERMVRVD
jgi:hypothetical protein